MVAVPAGPETVPVNGRVVPPRGRDVGAVGGIVDGQMGRAKLVVVVVGRLVAAGVEGRLALGRHLQEHLVEGCNVGRRFRAEATASLITISDSPQLVDTESAMFWLAASAKASKKPGSVLGAW